MLFSKVYNCEDLEIINEQEFSTLGLASQKIDVPFITFVKEKKYLSKLSETVTMVVTTKDLVPYIKGNRGIVISSNPVITFFSLHNSLSDNINYARVTDKTQIGNNCKISKFSSISETGVVIGNNVIIEDFVTIYENVTIKDNVIIRSGTKIGGMGFEYKKLSDGSALGVKHLGGVVIEEYADIHCNSCVDRAVYPWDNTIIGKYVCIDSLVHIGHGVKIGARTFVAACSCFGGRTEIGSDTWVGMGVTVKNALTVGDKASITMGSVLAENVDEEKEVSGFYAIEHKKFLYNQLRSRNI